MKTTVDQDTCIGCGLCPDLCPDVYEMRDDDKAHVIVDEVSSGSEECVQDAVEQCPVDAITAE